MGRPVQMKTLTCLHLLVLMATCFFLQGTEAVDCPPSWIYFQEHCYGVVTDNRTWAEAEVDCQTFGRGGHLASIASKQEGSVMSDHIKATFPGVKTVWIGLSDPRKSRNWAWSDLTPLFYQAWHAGEPNNLGEKEFCVHLSVADSKEWNDANCDIKMPSLCKFRL